MSGPPSPTAASVIHQLTDDDSTPVPSPQRRRLNPPSPPLLSPVDQRSSSPVVPPLVPHLSTQEDNACTICLEPWTTGGEHHICCLPCGHIFGYICVKKWLDTNRRSSCPTCKTRARVRDIRYLFGVNRLSAVDTSGLDMLRKDLAEEKAQHAATKSKLRNVERMLESCTRELQNVTKKHSIEFGGEKRSVARVLVRRKVEGGVAAVTFQDGALLYGEGRGAQRICRLELGGGRVETRFKSERRINGIGVASGFVGIVGTEKKIYVCTKDLNKAGECATNVIPLSITWLRNREHLMVSGMMDGGIRIYDIRNLGMVVGEGRISKAGNRGIHTVREVNGKIYAAAGCGVFKVDIENEVEVEEMSGGWLRHIYGMGSCDGKIVVGSVGERHKGRIVVFEGGGGKEEVLEGFVQTRPLGGVACLGGGIALSGDGEDVRIWGGGGFRAEGIGGVRCADSMRLPRAARLQNVPRGSRGVFGCGGDGWVALYAAGWY